MMVVRLKVNERNFRQILLANLEKDAQYVFSCGELYEISKKTHARSYSEGGYTSDGLGIYMASDHGFMGASKISYIVYPYDCPEYGTNSLLVTIFDNRGVAIYHRKINKHDISKTYILEYEESQD